MALKSLLGDNDDAYITWIKWSKTSDKFRQKDADAVWRSFRQIGGIGGGTLFHIARQAGWEKAHYSNPFHEPWRWGEPDKHRKAALQKEIEEREEKARKASQIARVYIARAEFRVGHPYLVKKGFPWLTSLVMEDENLLIVPMYRINQITGVQTISATGEKKFAPAGCRASLSVHKIGRREGTGIFWLVEGYATGLSVYEALKRMYRADMDEVVVCFSAGNLRRIAGLVRNPRAVVIADNDYWLCRKCSHRFAVPWGNVSECAKCKADREFLSPPTGESVARESRHEWWMPEQAGMDANDVMVSQGIDHLTTELRAVLSSLGRRGPR